MRADNPGVEGTIREHNPGVEGTMTEHNPGVEGTEIAERHRKCQLHHYKTLNHSTVIQ